MYNNISCYFILAFLPLIHIIVVLYRVEVLDHLNDTALSHAQRLDLFKNFSAEDHIIHMLASREYQYHTIYRLLKIEGMTIKLKYVKDIMETVGSKNYSTQNYKLKRELWSKVQVENWPFYTPEERIKVRADREKKIKESADSKSSRISDLYGGMDKYRGMKRRLEYVIDTTAKMPKTRKIYNGKKPSPTKPYFGQHEARSGVADLSPSSVLFCEETPYDIQENLLIIPAAQSNHVSPSALEKSPAGLCQPNNRGTKNMDRMPSRKSCLELQPSLEYSSKARHSSPKQRLKYKNSEYERSRSGYKSYNSSQNFAPLSKSRSDDKTTPSSTNSTSVQLQQDSYDGEYVNRLCDEHNIKAIDESDPDFNAEVELLTR